MAISAITHGRSTQSGYHRSSELGSLRLILIKKPPGLAIHSFRTAIEAALPKPSMRQLSESWPRRSPAHRKSKQHRDARIYLGTHSGRSS